MGVLKKFAPLLLMIPVVALAELIRREQNQTEIPGMERIANPMVPVRSYNDFDRLELALQAPDYAKHVKYFIIAESLAQINFWHNGMSCCLRAANTEDDISGVYLELKEDSAIDVFSQVGVVNLKIFTTSEGGALARWRLCATNYTLFSDTVTDIKDFSMLAMDCIKTSFSGIE